MRTVTTDPSIYPALEKHVAGYFRIFEEFPTGVEFYVATLGRVTILDNELAYNFENEHNEVWMVFQIEENLFKVTGSKDSYGNSYWKNEFIKVKKKEKVTYEYV